MIASSRRAEELRSWRKIPQVLSSSAPPRLSSGVEARSGLEPWKRAELPTPPQPRGLGWLAVVGPGVIVLGGSIRSGEFLLGPAVFVRYGLSVLWVTTVAVVLPTIFNTEVMRYTLATGEPAFTGFMRTRPLFTVLRPALLPAGRLARVGRHGGGVDLLSVCRAAGHEHRCRRDQRHRYGLFAALSLNAIWAG
jgi:hypothetical protein